MNTKKKTTTDANSALKFGYSIEFTCKICGDTQHLNIEPLHKYQPPILPICDQCIKDLKEIVLLKRKNTGPLPLERQVPLKEKPKKPMETKVTIVYKGGNMDASKDFLSYLCEKTADYFKMDFDSEPLSTSFAHLEIIDEKGKVFTGIEGFPMHYISPTDIEIPNSLYSIRMATKNEKDK